MSVHRMRACSRGRRALLIPAVGLIILTSLVVTTTPTYASSADRTVPADLLHLSASNALRSVRQPVGVDVATFRREATPRFLVPTVKTNWATHAATTPVLTLTVNTTRDSNATSTRTCLDRVITGCSLRAAIQTVDDLEKLTALGPIVIGLGAGSYSLDTTTTWIGSITAAVTPSAELFVDAPLGLSILGVGQDSTVITQSTTATRAHRLVLVQSGSSLDLSTLTLSGGEASAIATEPTAWIGGDLLSNAAVVTAVGVTFSGGSAGYGGGIASSGTLRLIDSTIVTDLVTTDDGVTGPVGGGGLFNTGRAELIATSVDHDRAINANDDTFIGCVVRPASAPKSVCTSPPWALGGGIDNMGTLAMNGGSVSHDVAMTTTDPLGVTEPYWVLGGGLLTVSSTTVLTGVVIATDLATGDGGSVSAYGGGAFGDLVATTCTFSKDRAVGESAGGGALAVFASGSILSSDTFSSDSAIATTGVAFGGAVASVVLTVSAVSLTVNGSTFEGDMSSSTTNTVQSTWTGGFGGALYIESAHAFLHVSTSIFSSNEAFATGTAQYSSAECGAICYTGSKGTLVVQNSTIASNVVTSPALSVAGGIGFSVTGRATLSRDVVSQNTSTTSSSKSVLSGGAGIYGLGVVDLTDSTIEGNSTSASGGGVQLIGNSTIDSTSIVSNHASRGGGALLVGGAATLTNDTIADDSTTTASTGVGGGILADSARIGLDADTIAFNAATLGAGIFERSTVGFLGDDAISGNTSTLSDAITSCDEGSRPFVSEGFNDIQAATGGRYGNTCVTPVRGDITAPARLSPVGEHGGSTPSAYPMRGSPLIGAGGDNCQPVDERAVGRPSQGCTIGAIEASDASVYHEVAADGGVFAFPSSSFFGSMGGISLNAPVVGIASNLDGSGYWLAGADGGVFAFPSSSFFGSMGGISLNAPVVGIASTPDGGGYWLVGADGGVFNFGDAHFYGSLGGTHLGSPIVGIASSEDGAGYWLVAADGSVYAFGDAPYVGEASGMTLNAPIVGIAGDGAGYWLVGADGGVFDFGSAGFFGSMGGTHLNARIVGIAASPDGAGYDLVGADGGVFDFGSAPFEGSMGGVALNALMVGID